MTHTILLALAPIFFVMILGYGAGKFQIVDNRHVDSFNALVMDFALPASLFVATASAPRSEMLSQASLFFVLGAVMLIVYLAWYYLVVRFTNLSKADASLEALTIAFPNMAGVALPIATGLLGPTGTVQVAIGIAAGSIIVSPLTLMLVELGVSKDTGAAQLSSARILKAMRHSLTKPIVLAPALGILYSLSGLPHNDVLDACLTLIGHAAAGVALFLTGLILSAQSFQLNGKILSATVVSNVVRPLLTAAVVFILPVAQETAKVAILLAAVPSGFFGILFAVNYRLDSATMGSMLIASTILSIVTMAVAIAVLFPG